MKKTTTAQTIAIILLWVVLFLCCFVPVTFGAILVPRNSKVVVLTGETYEDRTMAFSTTRQTTNSSWFVNFCTPYPESRKEEREYWFGRRSYACQKFAPTWNKLAKHFFQKKKQQAKNINITIATIDCYQDRKTCHRRFKSNYAGPTLKYFIDGKMYEYPYFDFKKGIFPKFQQLEQFVLDGYTQKERGQTIPPPLNYYWEYYGYDNWQQIKRIVIFHPYYERYNKAKNKFQQIINMGDFMAVLWAIMVLIIVTIGIYQKEEKLRKELIAAEKKED